MEEKPTAFFVNGERTIPSRQQADWTLTQYLRLHLGLTGTKQSCDNEGTCGSCTVIVDGFAKRSCLIKVSSLRSAQVTTIESLQNYEHGIPHPLLQTAIQDGIFQCGYCAPGALMVARSLLDRNRHPSLAEISQAISQVICRCAGLNRFDLSIARAASILRGEVSSTWSVEDTANEYMLLDKLTGRIKFTDDLTFPGMLFGVAKRSPLPHARVRKVSIEKAGQMPGVIKVITAKDIPGVNRYGLLTRDTPVFCDEVVRFTGDCLALVVAEKLEQAYAALDQIELDLEPLPVIADPEQALQPDAPVLHEYLRLQNPEMPNLLAHHGIRKGDIESGFSEAEIIIEGDYKTQFVDHAYMELECSIGVPESDGSLTVYCGSQGPTFDRAQVSEVTKLPEENIRIAHMNVGGGFGGKEDVSGQVLAGLSAYLLGRPVKVLFTRSESMRVHHKRHSQTMHYRSGATKDGRLVASEVRIMGDTGAYASTGEAVLFRSSTFCCGPYGIPNVKVDAYAVHTNNPTCGAFRGFGGTQVAFSGEVHLQKIIDALGMDPFEFRLKNAIGLGKATITGHVLDENVGSGFEQCLLAVRDALAKEPPPALRPNEKFGLGVAGAYKNVGLGSGIPDGAGASIALQPNGKFLVRHGAADLGQGSDEAMTLIVSRTLEVPKKLIQIHAGDTKLDPIGGMTTASRVTFVTGNATYQAAVKLRHQLWMAVSSEFSVLEQDLIIQDGAFVDRKSGNILVTLTQLGAGGENYFATANYDSPVTNRVPPRSDCFPTKESSDHRLHFAYCYGVQAATVAVNQETGHVRVLKIIAAHDVGSPISRRNCIGQIEGATVQGLGFALSEGYYLENGYPKTTKFSDLGLSLQKDIPEIKAILIENPHPFGPYGAKGMGELAISPTAPAIVNAIHDAVGIWMEELPVTREKILSRLKFQAGDKL
jgi:CO/xanthine dehydrogenase Mo-binding subunit/aerobic-type carbon monoxide dehydrogenase small subunit (CoxS/CutS family)